MVRRSVGLLGLVSFSLAFALGCNQQELVSEGIVEAPPGEDPTIGGNVPDEPGLEPSLPEGHYAFRDLFQQTMTEGGKVDVLWVIDHSGSMDEEQNAVASRVDDFTATFVNYGLDFQMAVISMDVDDQHWATDRGQFRAASGNPLIVTASTLDFGTVLKENIMSILLGEASPSAEEQGMEAARLALDPTAEPTTSGHNAGFLRNDAVLAVIFVSDENDFSVLQPNSTSGVQHAWWCDRNDVGYSGWGYPTDATAVCAPVSAYTDFFLNLKGGDTSLLQLSAIIDPGGSSDCSSARTGSRYLELMTATGGITERVCEAEMGPAMTRMSELIASKALTRFKMTHIPVPGTVVLRIDGVEIAAGPDTWQWDEAANAVVFADGAAPTECAELEIGYQTTDTNFDPHVTTGGEGRDPLCASTTPPEPPVETPVDPTGVDQGYPYEGTNAAGGGSMGGGCSLTRPSDGAAIRFLTLALLLGLGTLTQRRRQPR